MTLTDGDSRGDHTEVGGERKMRGPGVRDESGQDHTEERKENRIARDPLVKERIGWVNGTEEQELPSYGKTCGSRRCDFFRAG
jgi:hypothetical protein